MGNSMHISGNTSPTPKSRVLLQKLIVVQLVKNYTWLPTEIPLISPNLDAIYHQGTPNNRRAWPTVHQKGVIRVVRGVRNAKRRHLIMRRALYTRNHHNSSVDYRQSAIHDTRQSHTRDTNRLTVPPGVARMASWLSGGTRCPLLFSAWERDIQNWVPPGDRAAPRTAHGTPVLTSLHYNISTLIRYPAATDLTPDSKQPTLLLTLM
jgi:hypothetical protein